MHPISANLSESRRSVPALHLFKGLHRFRHCVAAERITVDITGWSPEEAFLRIKDILMRVRVKNRETTGLREAARAHH